MVKLAIDKVYGAEITIKVDKAKNKLNEVSNVAQSLGKKLQELNRFDVVGGQTINIFSNKINTAGSKAKLLGNNLKLIKPAIKDATDEIQDFCKEENNAKDKGKNLGEEISKSFSKGLKSVKRLTLGFLGARTAFSLFRKYMSEYQSQNEAFSQKMQLTTNVITNALAPAFEFFGNVIQYVVIGLARVIELLFGVNILGKTVDNSLKGASQSAKELNENLSGLDEISNIDQSSASGLASGITGQLEAMEEFKKKIAEVDNFFKKFKIDKIILGIRDAFKTVWDFATEHPILTTALVAGLIALKTGILPGLISSIAGAGAGAGLSLLGAFKLLVGGGIGIGVGILVGDMLNLEESVWKISKALDKEAKMWQSSADARKEYMKLTGEYTEQETKKTKKEYQNAIENLEAEKKELKKLVNLGTWIIDPAAYYDAKDKIKEIDKQIKEIKNSQMEVTVAYEVTNDKIGESIKMTDNMRKETEKSVKEANAIKDITADWEKNIDNADYKLNNFKGTYSTGFNKPITIDVDINTAKAKINFQSFVNNIKSMFSKSLGFIGTIPSYDVGTDYVPRDQLAMVHEGERIIPKQYNNSDYLGSLGSSETNQLLIELNRSILEFAKRPSVINVNGKELAKATYNDYQEESSRRGTNISVRRV